MKAGILVVGTVDVLRLYSCKFIICYLKEHWQDTQEIIICACVGGRGRGGLVTVRLLCVYRLYIALIFECVTI